MIKVLREQHEAPASVVHLLRLAGGINRYGEPNYRAVWGWSRLSWIGGKWADHDASGALVRERIELRQEPKYFPVDRWHIERWLAPESYGSPGQWYATTIETEDGIRIPALGPYPARGEYEHCFTLEKPGGGFAQLTADIAAYVARAIEFSRNQTSGERREAIKRREKKIDSEYDVFADEVLSDATPALHGQPFVTVA